MKIRQTFHSPILILSDTMRDTGQVRDVLDGEFDNISLSSDPEKMAAEFDARPADVLILAFDTLEKSERNYLSLYRQSAKLPLHPHRTIILSSKDNVAASYQACRKKLFDDYVLFWPMYYDRHRLAMSIHLALSHLADRGVITQPDSTWQKPDEIFKELCVSIKRTIGAPDTQELQNQPMGGGLAVAERKITFDSVKTLPIVMVVDDDEFMCKLLSDILEEAGYQILVAHGASEVLSTIRKQLPDLIIMDILMPGVNGIEIAQHLKAVPRWALIPLIIVTGNSDHNIVNECLKIGVVDFIIKPVERTGFLNKVRSALQRN